MVEHIHIDEVISEAEANLGKGFRQEGSVEMWILRPVARGARTFLSNLLKSPDIEYMEHYGLLIKDPVLDLYTRLEKGKLEERKILERHLLSTADIDLLQGLVKNPLYKKQKEGVGTNFTARLRVVAKDHDQALRLKRLEELAS